MKKRLVLLVLVVAAVVAGASWVGPDGWSWGDSPDTYWGS